MVILNVPVLGTFQRCIIAAKLLGIGTVAWEMGGGGGGGGGGRQQLVSPIFEYPV